MSPYHIEEKQKEGKDCPFQPQLVVTTA